MLQSILWPISYRHPSPKSCHPSHHVMPNDSSSNLTMNNDVCEGQLRAIELCSAALQSTAIRCSRSCHPLFEEQIPLIEAEHSQKTCLNGGRKKQNTRQYWRLKEDRFGQEKAQWRQIEDRLIEENLLRLKESRAGESLC